MILYWKKELSELPEGNKDFGNDCSARSISIQVTIHEDRHSISNTTNRSTSREKKEQRKKSSIKRGK